MRESKSRALPLGDTPVSFLDALPLGGKTRDWDHLPIPCFLGWVKGLEPSTPGTTIRCSNQLSYTHQIYGILLARQKGFEPLACCLEGSCSIQLSYWRIVERVTRIELASPAWKAGALAIVLHPRMGRSRSAAANRQLLNNSTKRSVCQVLFRKLVSFFVASLPGAAAKLQGALPHHPFDDLNEARSVLGQG